MEGSVHDQIRVAVILLSGGMDSAVTLAVARQQGYACHTLTFAYHQRSLAELQSARYVSQSMGALSHREVFLDKVIFRGSALVDGGVVIPCKTVSTCEGEEWVLSSAPAIPSTYVPARNTVFLSIGLAYAEVLASCDIFFGANVIDYSGYPDCREEYIRAFEKMANLATKSAIEGQRLTIHTPLIRQSKADIVCLGQELGVDFADTVSCYQADGAGRACGSCDSCLLRKKGFVQAGIADPTRYFAPDEA